MLLHHIVLIEITKEFDSVAVISATVNDIKHFACFRDYISKGFDASTEMNESEEEEDTSSEANDPICEAMVNESVNETSESKFKEPNLDILIPYLTCSPLVRFLIDVSSFYFFFFFFFFFLSQSC